MIKKMKGFTLIELLIVVAIIGILAALLIPNAMMAIQKAKQKGTMKDVNTIATGMMDYITDKGLAPAPSPSGAVDATFTVLLSPFYMKVFPLNDQWGTAFNIYTGLECTGNPWGITNSGDDWAPDDYLVGSLGRDSAAGPQVYDPTNTASGFYQVNTMADFANDIVNWNGNMVIAPRTAGGAAAPTTT